MNSILVHHAYCIRISYSLNYHTLYLHSPSNALVEPELSLWEKADSNILGLATSSWSRSYMLTALTCCIGVVDQLGNVGPSNEEKCTPEESKKQ